LSKEKIKYPVCHLLFEEFPADPRVRRYVNALNEVGINTIIICFKSAGEKLFDMHGNNRVYRIPVSKHRQSFLLTAIEYMLFTHFASLLLLYIGIKYRPKVIHTHTLPDFLIFAGLINKIFGTKLILDLHELFPEVYMARRPEKAKSFYVKILKMQERLSVRLANLVITIHEPAKQIFINRNKGLENKIHIIMNGVDPDEIKSTTREPTDKFILIYNGTIVKLWNLQLVVRSLAILKNKLPPEDYKKIIFKLYGKGPVLTDILDLAKELGVPENVSYEGVFSSDKMYPEVLKANVCVLPAEKNIYTDLFYTIKLTEMVYFKIPVIASRLNTYLLYYGEGSLFYIDSGNAEQLAERIAEVFYNKNIAKQKTEKAYSDYRKVSWDIMKEKYIKIISALLKDGLF
jgi:glycosyltransferase involved in cell wall biosynthesis